MQLMTGAVFDVESPHSPSPAPATPPTPTPCQGAELSNTYNDFMREQVAAYKRSAKAFSTKSRSLHGAQFDLTTPPRRERSSADDSCGGLQDCGEPNSSVMSRACSSHGGSMSLSQPATARAATLNALDDPDADLEQVLDTLFGEDLSAGP